MDKHLYKYKMALYVSSLIQEQKMTQFNLSVKSGVSLRTVAAVVGGERLVSIENMFKLAAAFKIDSIDFLALGYPVIKPFES
jgi:transcriptional regulator with XRE-family HTH domain